MKILLYAIFITLIATSCSNETEKIIERHSGGEKKVVAYYIEDGGNEKLIKKLTYDETGELILLEDLLKNERLDYLQLHPDLKTASGLKDYLRGKWVLDIHRGWWRTNKKGNASVYGSKLTYKYDTWWSYESGMAEIKYMPNYSVMLLGSTNKNIPDKIFLLLIKSPRTFTFAGDDVLVDFIRKDKPSTLDTLKGIVLITIDLGIIMLLLTPTKYNNSLDDFAGGAIKGFFLLLCIIALFTISNKFFY